MTTKGWIRAFKGGRYKGHFGHRLGHMLSNSWHNSQQNTFLWKHLEPNLVSTQQFRGKKKNNRSLAPHKPSTEEEFSVASTGVTGWRWRRFLAFWFQASRRLDRRRDVNGRRWVWQRRFRAVDHPKFPITRHQTYSMRVRSSTHSGDQIIKPYREIMSVLWATKAAEQTDTNCWSRVCLQAFRCTGT